MITFKHRFVPFGTRFTSKTGNRGLDDLRESNRLHQNEIAVDVGGCCFSVEDNSPLVVDHHCAKGECRYPSSSAGVLVHAEAIHDALGRRVTDRAATVWLVTHESADFDALASCFLLKGILDGSSAYKVPLAGWEELNASQLNWFEPPSSTAEECRWPLLVASYAAHIDQCRKLRCDRTTALHSVLYAALLRRSSEFLESGATHFFQSAVNAIRTLGLNPLFDSLFDGMPEWAPELLFLKRESDAYQKDIARARRCLVQVRKCADGFEHLLHRVEGVCEGDGIPLLHRTPDGNSEINTRHLRVMEAAEYSAGVQVDGVFIRDPECLLFKEWARNDTENSLLRVGFIFTAVGYSNIKKSPVNHSDYYFAIDPERIPGAHLYNVWVRLQSEEIRARLEGGLARPSNSARPGFENRGRGFDPYFADPWFDGQNYGGTVVVTPAEGTVIAPSGRNCDLTDDPIAAIVSEELEYSVFSRRIGESPQVLIHEFGMSPSAASRSRESPVPLGDGAKIGPSEGCFLFAEVQLHSDVDLRVPGLAFQIARTLWPFLEPPGVAHAPKDLEERHLSAYSDVVAIWNRRGIAVAYKAEARQRVDGLRENLRVLAIIASHISSMPDPSAAAVNHHRKNASNEFDMESGEQLLTEVVRLRLQAARPENRPLRQLMDAIQFDQIIQSLHALNQQAIGRQQEERALFLNLLVGLFALTFALPTLILTFFAVIHGPADRTIIIASGLPVLCGIVTAAVLWIRYRLNQRRHQLAARRRGTLGFIRSEHPA